MSEELKRAPRGQLIYALGRCVEVLATGPLMDGAGAIRAALEADERVWDHLSKDTLDTLKDVLFLTPPNQP